MVDVMGIAHRSEVVKTRRGYTLMGLSFLFPGSAQAIHGNRKLGRFALKLLIALVILGILILIATLVFRDFMVGVFANGLVMKIVAILIFSLGALWLMLALNSWWISRPRTMGIKKGIIFSVITLILAFSLTAGTAWVGNALWATGGALSNIFGGGGISEKDKGRYNILLLGSDAGPGRWGIRPDSVTVASIDGNTGRTVLFSLPRNLEKVPFPESSPLYNYYPNGYGCADSSCMLNAIYLLGVEHSDLYPGVDDPGIQAMIDAASGTTGLTINYYAMINMWAFVDLIDSMGGLEITVHERVPINADETSWLEVGDHHLTGYATLWFARSRSSSSDYARMQRQKCVMSAMLKQLDPGTVATQFTAIAAASGDLTHTSLPPWKVPEMVKLATKTKSLPMISVSFTPPLIATGNPDFGFIRTVVQDTIARSELLDVQATQAPETQAPTTDPVNPEPPPPVNPEPEPTTNVIDDLGQVCSVG
ncbi:MAG: LCP family protein [Propionibacteriaceae bacterium]|jgi:LCP family protein required for cell wall assembly|nr:LCP family protein [Propionibacteriaceae bacterium]